MPCTSCNADFNFFNWKLKCGECDDKYCNKCLKKREGILYCEKCMILLKRPPDRVKLMELKPKDLQAYLNKNNISTYGLVEKHELVDLLCNKHIPERPKKGFVEKVTANIAGSNQFNELIESIIPSTEQRPNRSKGPNAPNRTPKTSPPPRPNPIYGQNTPSSSTPQHSRTVPNVQVHPQPSAPPPPPPNPPSSPAAQNSTPSQESQPQASTSNSANADATATPKTSETPEGSPLPPRYPKLSDFKSIDDLNNLTSKQLKQLLTLNRVDFKGCVEKPELLEKAVRLWIDNYEQRKELPENIQDLCKLCMDGPLDCVLLECGHIATCIDCGKKLAECPICRQYVIRVVRTFKA